MQKYRTLCHSLQLQLSAVPEKMSKQLVYLQIMLNADTTRSILWACNHPDGEYRADCFTLIVFLVSCDGWCPVALPQCACVCLQCDIVVFPGHTHFVCQYLCFPILSKFLSW